MHSEQAPQVDKRSHPSPRKLVALATLLIIVAVGGIWLVKNVRRPASTARMARISQPDVQPPTYQVHTDRSKWPAMTPWPMFQGSALHTGRSPHDGPQEINIRWCFWTDGIIEGSPTIGIDGTIYLTSWDGHLYALAANGALKWIFKTRGRIRGSVAAAKDGTVYLASSDHTLYALDYHGALQWAFTAKGPNGASPTIGPDGTIYFGSVDHHLYALTPAGVLKWSYATDAVISYSAPAVGADGTVYIGSYDGHLYAVDAEGRLKWRYHTGTGMRTSPSIGSDGTIFIGGRDGKLYALTSGGELKWTYATDSHIRSSTAIGADGTVYFGSWDNKLYAIGPDGQLRWRYQTNGPVESSPTVGANGTVYVGSADGSYYALSSDGALNWKFQSEGILHAPAVISQDGAIYITSDSRLIALGPPLPSIVIRDMTAHATAKETVDVSLSFVNPSTRQRDVDVKVWLEPPNAGMVLLLTDPRKSLAGSADHTQTLSIGPLPTRGTYKISGRLFNAITGDLISESLATFTLAADGSAQIESSLAFTGHCRGQY